MAMTRTGLIALASCALALGCAQPKLSSSFDAATPQERSMALAEAVERGNHDDIGHLIGMLDSSDPALRMFAERALERLTGQTFEYRFSDPEPERAQAVARWVAWYEGEEPAS